MATDALSKLAAEPSVCAGVLGAADNNAPSAMPAAAAALLFTDDAEFQVNETVTWKGPAAIETGRDDGMQSFNQALYDMVKAGRITREDALEKATNPQALEMMFQGISLTTGSRILG